MIRQHVIYIRPGGMEAGEISVDFLRGERIFKDVGVGERVESRA
jgi:hypothetical protein